MTLPHWPGDDPRAGLSVYPAVFDRAIGSVIFDDGGRSFLDFYSAAGTLAYGHNNPAIKHAVAEYLAGDRISHSLDLPTVAKQEFLSAFEELICRPRRLDYQLLLCDAGQQPVEAALSLARRITGRTAVLCFTENFRGVRVGAAGHDERYESSLLARPVASSRRPTDAPMPDIGWLDDLLRGAARGRGRPAAVLVEGAQDEAGVTLPDMGWLRVLATRCRDYGILLIYDDRRMGCGRSGPFFSFERAGIEPDVVCLSHCAGGFGLPLDSTLVTSRLAAAPGGEKEWESRGRDISLVAAAAALRVYWRDASFARRCLERGDRLSAGLRAIATRARTQISARGVGLAHAIFFAEPSMAEKVGAAAFERGLLLGPVGGSEGGVIRLTPPLTTTDDEIDLCIALLGEAVEASEPSIS